MNRNTVGIIPESVLIMDMLHLLKKLVNNITTLGGILIFSEDARYKYHFISDYMPKLYKKHTSQLYMNCIFCSNLVRSGCHKNCFKCSVGSYIKCSSLLPGILDFNPRHANFFYEIELPWYFQDICSSFRRLPPDKYFRNLHKAFSALEICNFEVLEGLEKGLSSGEKPCHICASLDYKIYRKCSSHENFNISTPCKKIKTELKTVYQQL